MDVYGLKALALKGDQYFFAPASMKAFNSRVSKIVYPGNYDDQNGYFFVTSEQPPNARRRYTVRFMTLTGRVRTVSRGQEYSTLGGAQNRVDSLLRNGHDWRGDLPESEY